MVGVDLDGFVTLIGFLNPGSKKWWLLLPFFLLTLVILPNRQVVAMLNIIKKTGHKIIIVTTRPKWMRHFTRLWLNRHKVPYHKLVHVGLGEGTKERKLKVIKEEGIAVFLDDDPTTVAYLRAQGIDARHSLSV